MLRIRCAIENLSFLRSFGTADIVADFLKDADAAVRREAAMNLGWTGNRFSLKPLAGALMDSDWTVRQTAAIALENLAGQSFKFDGLAPQDKRQQQTSLWVDWIRLFSDEKFSAETRKVLLSPDGSFREKENAMRSIGMFNYDNNVDVVTELIRPYVNREVNNKKVEELVIYPTRSEYWKPCRETDGTGRYSGNGSDWDR
jgi:hypothetical protein